MVSIRYTHFTPNKIQENDHYFQRTIRMPFIRLSWSRRISFSHSLQCIRMRVKYYCYNNHCGKSKFRTE